MYIYTSTSIHTSIYMYLNHISINDLFPFLVHIFIIVYQYPSCTQCICISSILYNYLHLYPFTAIQLSSTMYVSTLITHIHLYSHLCAHLLLSSISTIKALFACSTLSLRLALIPLSTFFIPHLSGFLCPLLGFPSSGLAMHNGLCGTRFKHVWNSICSSLREILFVLTKRLKIDAELLPGIFTFNSHTHTHTQESA